MAKPYLYERQSEYWTSRQIEEFFLDAGFELIALPILQYHEKTYQKIELTMVNKDGKMRKKRRALWTGNSSNRLRSMACV